jgi:Asp-tRNA(Asn)/Glu-tRNA(Gln) amidotransferase A subunit family amidase
MRTTTATVLVFFACAALVAQGDRFDVLEKTIPELQTAIQAGQLTSRELVSVYLARIDAYDRRGPQLNAVVALNPNALRDAEALDRERAARGPRGPLHGIPILVKDNYETVDMPTAAGSIALAGYQSKTDAFQVRKLRDAGAVIIGKTNMHELAYGITNISSVGGQTRNPYDLSRAPGGSSGGTGAAIAANFAAAGMGSDTCGSIRIPASSNNLVGLRGTRGLASGSGIVPLSKTQDIGGPIARTLRDLAILLDATVGVDPADEATRAAGGHIPKSYVEALRPDGLKGARLGLLKSYFAEDEDGSAVVRRAIDQMKKDGAEVVEIDVPGLADLLRDSSLIVSEFKFDLAEFLAARENAPVRSLDEILRLGLHDVAVEAVLRRSNATETRESDAYRRALVKREAIRHAVVATLDEHRLAALVYPTIRRKPVRIGEPQPGSNCQLSAASGLPALSVPAGFTDDGLPIGVEFLGRPWTENELLRLGYGWEQAARLRRTPFSTPALVNGRAPAPVTFDVRNGVLRGRFTYDRTTGALAYEVGLANVAADDLRVVALHRGTKDGPGPIVARLVEPGSVNATGSISLGYFDRAALAERRLYVQAYTRQAPAGTLRTALVLPGT